MKLDIIRDCSRSTSNCYCTRFQFNIVSLWFNGKTGGEESNTNISVQKINGYGKEKKKRNEKIDSRQIYYRTRISYFKRNPSIPSLLEERKSSSTKITPPTPALTTKAPFQIRMNNDPIKIGRLYLSDNDYAIKPRLRCSLTTAVGVTIISIIDA